MTQVDFYILPGTEQQERLQFVCRLTEKAYKLGHKLYIHTDEEQTSALIDDALWQFRTDSFIPHQRIDQPNDAPAPVEIGHQTDPKQHQDILINLAYETPSFFSRFHRVAEVVIQHPQSLAASRKSYGFYRDRGYPMKTHDMRKK